MKICKKCGETLPIESFYVRKSAMDGRTTYCADCNKKSARDYRSKSVEQANLRSKEWRLKNKSRVQEYNKAYNLQHTEDRKLKYQSKRVSRVSRSDDEILRDRDRLRPEGIKKCYRCKEHRTLDYFRTNKTTPDGLAGDCNLCRQSRLFLVAKFSERGVPLICVYCSGPYQHVDHVMPRALGGEDVPHNLVPSCLPCNLSKGYIHPEIWISSIFPNTDSKTKALEWGVKW